MKNNTYCWMLPALLFTVSPVMATECYDPSPFSGFYIGADLGGSFTSAKEYSRINANNDIDLPANLITLSTNTFSHALSSGHRKNRLAAGVYGGYGYVCAQMYWGLEVFVNYSGHKTRSNKNLTLQEQFPGISLFTTTTLSLTDAISTRIKLKRGEAGFDFRPGYFIAPCTMLYGRIGVGYNKISIRTSLRESFLQNAVNRRTLANNAISLAAAFDVQRKKTVGAFRLGIGLEQNICDNLTVRADYVNTNYRHLRLHRSFTFTNAQGNTATLVHAFKLSRFMNNSVTLGLSYYW